MNDHWRTKPRVPIVIAALPYAMVAAMLLWALAYRAQHLGHGFGPNSSTFASGFFIFIFSVWVSHVIVSLATYRAWQRIASDFNACPCCEYPLRGLPAAARCPECGEPYEAEGVETHWKACLHKAAKSEACLRLCPSGMQRYMRCSIWMLGIAGLCIGLGVLDTFYSLIPGRMTGLIIMSLGFAILFVQHALLARMFRNAETKNNTKAAL